MAERKGSAGAAARPNARPNATPAFMGPPGRLRWAGLEGAELGAPVAVKLPDALANYVNHRHPALRSSRSGARTRLRLAADTPPGIYNIAVEYAGGVKKDVEIAVQPRARLHVVPGTLRLAGAPGQEVSATLLLENRGNEALEISDALVTGLFDNEGIEAALAAMYRLDSDDLNKIVAAGFSRLRQAHGGLLKLRVSEGAGKLAPGERRQLLLETTLSNKLEAGHGYHGTLALGPHRIAVQVGVLAAATPKTTQTRGAR